MDDARPRWPAPVGQGRGGHCRQRGAVLWGLRGQSHPAHPVLSVPVADLGTAHSRVVVNEAAFIDVIYRPLSSQELRSRCPPVWRPRRPRRPLLAVEQSRAPCRPASARILNPWRRPNEVSLSTCVQMASRGPSGRLAPGVRLDSRRGCGSSRLSLHSARTLGLALRVNSPFTAALR